MGSEELRDPVRPNRRFTILRFHSLVQVHSFGGTLFCDAFYQFINNLRIMYNLRLFPVVVSWLSYDKVSTA